MLAEISAAWITINSKVRYGDRRTKGVTADDEGGRSQDDRPLNKSSVMGGGVETNGTRVTVNRRSEQSAQTTTLATGRPLPPQRALTRTPADRLPSKVTNPTSHTLELGQVRIAPFPSQGAAKPPLSGQPSNPPGVRLVSSPRLATRAPRLDQTALSSGPPPVLQNVRSEAPLLLNRLASFHDESTSDVIHTLSTDYSLPSIIKKDRHEILPLKPELGLSFGNFPSDVIQRVAKTAAHYSPAPIRPRECNKTASILETSLNNRHTNIVQQNVTKPIRLRECQQNASILETSFLNCLADVVQPSNIQSTTEKPPYVQTDVPLLATPVRTGRHVSCQTKNVSNKRKFKRDVQSFPTSRPLTGTKVANTFDTTFWAADHDRSIVFGDLSEIERLVLPSPASKPTKAVSLHLPCREAAEANVRALSLSAETDCSMLLGTALVLLDDANGHPQIMRGIIDTGSQINLITRSAAAVLNHTPTACTTTLHGLGSIRAVALGQICTTLRSRLDSTFAPAFSATITDSIVGKLPNHAIDSSVKRGFDLEELADPTFDTPGNIDVLLGVEVVGKILDYEGLNITSEPAYALGTRLGRIILGAVPVRPKKRLKTNTSCLTTSDPLVETLAKFWEAEEPLPQVFTKPEDDLCEKIYRQTTKRTPDGRYVVALPFANDSFSLQSNRNATFSKFRSFERRTGRDEDLKAKFVEFMNEYRDLGHMVPTLRRADYIIPYHCVLRPSSTTTKLRTVFNASAPDIHGHTLNEQLLSGPKLQLDLPHILVNFRLHNVVVCADVRMMFRQILVRKQDRIFQHIFYREGPTEPVQEFELTTVTYGMNCSPFLAQRTLLQLVEDEGAAFPMAANALRNCTYVDDIVAGAESTEEAKDLVGQLNGLLDKGGFELRKWSSNDRDIVHSLEDRLLENPLLFSDDSMSVKILGMKWMPSHDHFEYQIQPFSASITKRNILSYVACMYDPLGLLTPVTFWIKHFIQLLWLAKSDWDEELPTSLNTDWNNFADGLLSLEELSIPRQVGNRSAELRLLGFADASGKGYAACIYLHSTYNDGSITVHLLRAKSKVAPLTTSTIPRLELCGAWLLARLLNSCLESLHSHHVTEARLHSDAKVILSWISTPPHRLKMFVANRVAKILEHSKPTDWFHVKTEDNPADVASRGCRPTDLKDHALWWNGPDYYQTPRENWPERTQEEEVADLPELKTETSTALVVKTTCPGELPGFLTKFSSYRTSVRVTAYILRFINHCRRSRPPKTEVLTAKELQDASDFCALQVQRAYFTEERQELAKGKTPKKLKSLTPHLDSNGLIRVGGRLVNAHVSAGARHPILLPKRSHFTDLVCDYHHGLSCHAGPRATQASVLQRFWILSMRTVIRQRYHGCFKCYRLSAKPLQPTMGALPLSRVGQCRPFSKVGIDFAGPFNTRQSTARKANTTKAYLCVFVCMTVKAVHLEFVSELSTKAFLNAYDRFVARRGLPTDVFSDNGTNFVGADKQLRDTLAHLRADDKDIFGHLAAKGTNWHFNPPAAPNFGGLWEAAVKSAKTLLKRSLGEVSQTFEEYTTFFCKVEAVLNSRPLLDFSTEPSDSFSMLTPGHFLIGTALTAPPEPQLAENATYPCKWKRIRQQLQGFWRQWSKEYLHTLLQQHKWTTTGQTVEPGQLVFLYGTTTNPLEWPLARVVSIHPGADGVTRVATVKTATSTLLRPLNKLVPLPPA